MLFCEESNGKENPKKTVSHMVIDCVQYQISVVRQMTSIDGFF